MLSHCPFRNLPKHDSWIDVADWLVEAARHACQYGQSRIASRPRQPLSTQSARHTRSAYRVWNKHPASSQMPDFGSMIEEIGSTCEFTILALPVVISDVVSCPNSQTGPVNPAGRWYRGETYGTWMKFLMFQRQVSVSKATTSKCLLINAIQMRIEKQEWEELNQQNACFVKEDNLMQQCDVLTGTVFLHGIMTSGDP